MSRSSQPMKIPGAIQGSSNSNNSSRAETPRTSKTETLDGAPQESQQKNQKVMKAKSSETFFQYDETIRPVKGSFFGRTMASSVETEDGTTPRKGEGSKKIKEGTTQLSPRVFDHNKEKKGEDPEKETTDDNTDTMFKLDN